MLIFIWAGIHYPIIGPTLADWKVTLLLYAFAASILPVWMLLQPRDYINSLFLYFGVGAMYIGFAITNPSFAAPAINPNPAGAPAMFPFVFVIIACGSASGFHALVSSGTSAKQLDRETDARFIGYGAMIGESLFGLMAVLACTAGFVSREAWLEHYRSWQSADNLGLNIASFINGTVSFLAALGLPSELAGTFVSVLVVSFALTSLDSATRILRYNVSEIGETLRIQAFGNRYVASAVAVTAIAIFAFYQVGGEFAGLVLWQLFGTTNQLMAGLALLAVTIYLMRRGKPIAYTAVPMVFIFVSTVWAMVSNLLEFWSSREWILLITGGAVLVLALWLVVEACLAVGRYRKHPVLDGVEVEFQQDTALPRPAAVIYTPTHNKS
jgi:carbon starvation protein